MSALPEPTALTPPDVTAPAPGPPRYVGLITRAIAFVLDAAVINVVAIVAEVGAALILSVVHLPQQHKNLLVALGAGAYALWAFAYFAGFWAATGQTPGNRVMQIRVVSVNGEVIKPRRAVVRCFGLLLAALPLFAGYLMIPFNRRRRGLQDYLARTVVVEAPQLSVAATRGQRTRSARAAVDGGASGATGARPPRLNGSSDSGDDRDSAQVQG